jgi:EmrB/QacA subfamily drug resistance transporter
LFTAGLGAFMATMDTSLVSVGLPQIATSLGTSVAAVSWVMVAYLLASASLQIVVGRLADIAAPGRLFAAGVALFSVASGLGGMSPGFHCLIMCRLAQGVGGALMLGVAPKLIALSFPEGERGFALGMFSMGFATGVTLGAPLGGLLLTFLNWRALFFVNPLLGAILLATGSRVLGKFPRPRTWEWRTLDPYGGMTITATLAMFILTLTWVRDHGVTDVRNLIGLVGVAGGVALLTVIERRQSNPLLHRDLWQSRAFILGVFGVLMAFACVMGSFFLLPFFLVQVFHFSPAMMSLMLAVLAISNACMAFLGGYLADRLGNVLILRIGLGLICVGLGWLSAATGQTSTLSLAGRLALTGMGLGLFSAPNLNEIISGVEPRFMGLAASTSAVMKNLGALMGVIVLVAALGWGSEAPVTLKSAACFGAACFARAFWLAASLAILNFLVNLLPRKRGRAGGGAEGPTGEGGAL